MKPTVILTDERAEEFLARIVNGKSNKHVCKEMGISLADVKVYRDKDMAAGGNFYSRWSGATGENSSRSVTAQMEVLRKKIFDGAGELNKFLTLNAKTPMWARFEYSEKAGRRVVMEVSHEDHEGQEEAGWDINPDWREVRYFNMRYVLPTLVPKLAVAQVKVEHGKVSRSEIEIAAEGKMLFDNLMKRVAEQARNREFQANELATIEAPGD